MSVQSTYTVLLADPDSRTRTLLAAQLASTGCSVVQATDGETALQIVNQGNVRVVVAELYLETKDDDCLIHAIRRSKALRKTRTVAHTSRGTPADREWAMRAGADAYLIKPTRAERFRYVVGRLATATGANATLPSTPTSSISRRDSLEIALGDLEAGKLSGASAIVFSRAWWDNLSRARQDKYHARAKRVGIRLRSDTMLGEHFVEVRGTPMDQPLSTERPETPYRD